MTSDSMLSFDELVAARQQLQRFCLLHYHSLVSFHDGISFKLTLDEPSLGAEARHLSSTATCIESLLDCPRIYWPKPETDFVDIAQRFAVSAMLRRDEEWKSDGSAPIYCRCRTLPLIVYHLPTFDDGIKGHIARILNQLHLDPSRFAIGEASDYEPNQHNWYPPNAFHTYWTLQLLHAVEERFPPAYTQLCEELANTRFEIARVKEEMILWAHRTAGYQVTLHVSESASLDSDQLLWALAMIVKFGRDFQANAAQQDFIRYALKTLFEHQTSSGTWRTGAPLFHYLKSGNAYCYVFESLTVLLRSALTDRKEGIYLRQILRPYANNLLRLWRYATSTQIPLAEFGKVFGWNSGHQANRSDAESWATASVYSFSQCLRRLLGIWTRETAAEQVAVLFTHGSPVAAQANLAARGDTWALDGATAATQLMTLFVNPVRYFSSSNSLDPDSQPINDDQARAAILFGPPGTSKTTLSRSVADAIDWDYVEIHASHFVSEGLSKVQRTADGIFERLEQLDRTVILFDEIDELVRAREVEPDAFGRFLTTSMLPKLAELWKRRKVIYFIATNHIRFFDSAVTRAQRFDALIHVSPPSFTAKKRQLIALLKELSINISDISITQQDIENALEEAANLDDSDLLPKLCTLAKFLLMRWDQLQELAWAIKRRLGGATDPIVTRDVFERALSDLSDPVLKICRPFKEFREARDYEQHDFSKVSIWEVRGDVSVSLKDKLERRHDRYWYISRSGFSDFSDFPKECERSTSGILTCRQQ